VLEGLVLSRDPDAEKRLYAALRESFGTDERTGIHLSALLNPLQEYWRRKEGRPPLTDTEIGYFTAGRGHEDILARLLKDDFELTPEEEIDGIHLRPDFRALNDKIIPKGAHAEFKTRRSNLPKTDAEAQSVFQSYRDQIRGYMALKNQPEMYLIVLSLLEGRNGDPLNPTRPVIAVYRETMTEAEMADEKTTLLRSKVCLEIGAAILLPLCWQFLCGKWTKTKTGFVYEPKCPHYAKCQPQLRDSKRGLSYARSEASRPGLPSQEVLGDPVRAEREDSIHPVEGLSGTSPHKDRS
jgi:hypothetical protein